MEGGTTQDNVLEVTSNPRGPSTTSLRQPHGDQKATCMRRRGRIGPPRALTRQLRSVSRTAAVFPLRHTTGTQHNPRAEPTATKDSQGMSPAGLQGQLRPPPWGAVWLRATCTHPGPKPSAHGRITPPPCPSCSPKEQQASQGEAALRSEKASGLSGACTAGLAKMATLKCV